MLGFFVQRLLRATLGCVPAVAVFVLFTDQTVHFLDSIFSTIPVWLQNADIIFAIAVTVTFFLLLIVHKRFLRKNTYAILYSVLQTIILLSLMGCLVLVVGLFLYKIHAVSIAIFYLSSALALCGFASVVTTCERYSAITPKYLTHAETIMDRHLSKAQYEEKHATGITGFLWKDFDMGLVIHREETDQLIESLKSQKTCFLVGEQASGKSVITRSVAHQLVLNRHIVFIIEDTEDLDVDRAAQDASLWNLANVLLIVDDVHRNPRACSELLKRLSRFEVRILFSSRSIDPSVFREGEGQDLLHVYGTKIEAKVSNQLVHELIRNRSRSAGASFKITEADVRTVIEKCGTDLWLINYLLMSWNPKKEELQEVGKERIYERVYETRVQQWRRIEDRYFRVMQVASALYIYEVPISEKYFDRLGLTSAALGAVVDGNLLRRGGYYSLHHASVARIYLETLAFYGFIQNDVDYCSEILSSYLTDCESERSAVLYKLGTFSIGDDSQTSAIIQNILRSITVKDIVLQIERENDIQRIGLFLRNVSRINAQLARKVLCDTDINLLKAKVAKEVSNRTRKNFLSDVISIDKEYDHVLSKWKLPLRVALAPLYNEERYVGDLIAGLSDYADYVLVIDDASVDKTAQKARKHGAQVVSNSTHKGMVESIFTGVETAIKREAHVGIFCSMSALPANGETQRLIRPVLNDQSDLVVGCSKYQVPPPVRREFFFQVMNRLALNAFLKYANQTRLQMKRHGVTVTAILFKKILRVTSIEYRVHPTRFGRLAGDRAFTIWSHDRPAHEMQSTKEY
jgi:hypothetical protein